MTKQNQHYLSEIYINLFQKLICKKLKLTRWSILPHGQGIMDTPQRLIWTRFIFSISNGHSILHNRSTLLVIKLLFISLGQYLPQNTVAYWLTNGHMVRLRNDEQIRNHQLSIDRPTGSKQYPRVGLQVLQSCINTAKLAHRQAANIA